MEGDTISQLLSDSNDIIKQCSIHCEVPDHKHQNTDVLEAAGVLYQPENEGLSQQVQNMSVLALLYNIRLLVTFQTLDAQHHLKGRVDDGIAVAESATALLAIKDELPQLGTNAVSHSL